MKFNNVKKYILSLASLLFMATACEVTDTAPSDRIPEDVAFSDAARVESNVIGAYQAAQLGWYAGSQQRGYPFGAASIEQGDMRGEDMYNDQLFYEVTYTNTWTPSTANNNGMWISLYRLINRVNVVIEGIERAREAEALTADEADNFRGEMLFLRALSHHELLIHFARPYSDDPSLPGVPYRTFAIDDASKEQDGLDVGRGTIQEAYNKLLADLDEAEALLGDDNGTFRATRGAAIALKTRVKLHMEDFEGVIEEFEKINTLYSLTASPEEPFVSGETSENIFSFQNSDASNAGVNGALVNMYGNNALGGRALVKISPVIWKESFWLENDLRRTLLTTESALGKFTHKYRAYGVFDDPTPIIRYAEVVLNAAEAHARKAAPDLNAAVTLLNSVRDRAIGGAPSYTVAGLGGDVDGVLEGIFNERRIEFLAEGRRWADIHRLSGAGLMDGVPLKAQTRSVTSIDQYQPDGEVTLDHSLSYSEATFIWPIPLEEILNNPVLAEQQNPSY